MSARWSPIRSAILCALVAIATATRRHSTNHMMEYESTCSRNNMAVNITMNSPFKGVVFAKGFPDLCSSYGTFDSSIKLSFPTSGCGVRMEPNTAEGEMIYSVKLVIQMDSKLRQAADQESVFKCKLPMKETQIEIPAEMLSPTRVGRMKNDWSKPERVRIWMELLGTGYEGGDVVEVGEPTTINIRSVLPARIDMRVVDCAAMDGLGDVSQKLLDERGCPIDSLIMPELMEIPTNNSATAEEEGWSKSSDEDLILKRHFTTTFPAFKFPDRDRIHLNCGVLLCLGKCQKINCQDEDEFEQTFIDRVDVFNSLLVLAPNIEIDKLRHESRVNMSNSQYEDQASISGSTGRKKAGTLCLSPNKLALAFCALGLVFLIAVIVALCSLIRARATRSDTRSAYAASRSGYSINSSTSGIGSKLLRSDLTWPYGRVY